MPARGAKWFFRTFSAYVRIGPIVWGVAQGCLLMRLQRVGRRGQARSSRGVSTRRVTRKTASDTVVLLPEAMPAPSKPFGPESRTNASRDCHPKDARRETCSRGTASRRVANTGAGTGNRTPDLVITSDALYRLSYSGVDGKKMVPKGGVEPPTRGFSVRCSTN